MRGPIRRWGRPMTIHGSLFQEFKEKDTQDPFSLQNKKMLRIDMRYGEVWARTGSMVAYQGDVRFANKGSGGISKMLKAATTGEGVKMMQCSGSVASTRARASAEAGRPVAAREVSTRRTRRARSAAPPPVPGVPGVLMPAFLISASAFAARSLAAALARSKKLIADSSVWGLSPLETLGPVCALRLACGSRTSRAA